MFGFFRGVGVFGFMGCTGLAFWGLYASGLGAFHQIVLFWVGAFGDGARVLGGGGGGRGGKGGLRLKSLKVWGFVTRRKGFDGIESPKPYIMRL